MSVRPVFRFAPSPNGLLHLGHAYSALLNQQRAREAGGDLLLRMEDIDVGRCRPEFEAAIVDDLTWLGVAWQGDIRRQSEHFAAYGEALAQLDAIGVLVRCYASRGEIRSFVASAEAQGRAWPRDPDGAPLFPGDAAVLAPAEIARRRAGDAPYVLRLDMRAALARVGALTWNETGGGPHGETGEIAADPRAWGDVVLARKDVPTSYHLAVVVDDALQRISDVVRGRDLFAATAVHRVLQALLGLPVPRYHHHRLIVDAAGRKLSKSDADTGLAELRAHGATPADVRRMIGF